MKRNRRNKIYSIFFAGSVYCAFFVWIPKRHLRNWVVFIRAIYWRLNSHRGHHVSFYLGHVKSNVLNNTCTNITHIQYIPKNMHTVFALLCFVVVIHWLIFPYPSGLLHWHCGNLTIAPVPAKQPWWIWINTSCEFIMNDCITTTKQSTTKPCAYFMGYTVHAILPVNGGESVPKRCASAILDEDHCIFSRISVRKPKMNVVACTQFEFQMLT